MTRRKWLGHQITGPYLGKNSNFQLPMTPLGAGQPPLIPMQMSGSGSGLILPMVPIWIPPPLPEILPPPPPPPPPPPVEGNCIDLSGNAYRWLFTTKELIIPAKPCSVHICWNPDDILPDDIEYAGIIANGSIYDTLFGARGTLPCTLNMDGQIIVSDYDAIMYFYNNVPVYVLAVVHEVGDPYYSYEPFYEIAEYCAVQAGIEAQVTFINNQWNIVNNDYLGHFFFVYWYEEGYPCPDD